MIYTSDINYLINNIPANNILLYLRELGWQRQKTKRDSVMALYSSPSGLEKAHVVVPLKKDLADYKTAIKDVVRAISEVYKKDVNKVVTELLNPNADIIKIRVISKETENGVIGIDRGLDLFNNAKNMLLYSVREIIEYKQIYHGRSNADVVSIVDACRIGQTEIGSFLVSIICPFYELSAGKATQLTLYDVDGYNDSVTRKATTQLITSLSKIKTAVCEQNVGFLSSPESGISVNFLESLIKTGLSNSDCLVEVKAEWSPITPNKSVSTDVVRLSNENEYDAIKSAITHVKKFEPKTKTFLGKIRDLKSNPGKRDTGGTLTLVYVGEEDKTTSAKFTQTADLHDIAIEAYQQNADVKITATNEGANSNWVCEEIEIIC